MGLAERDHFSERRQQIALLDLAVVVGESGKLGFTDHSLDLAADEARASLRKFVELESALGEGLSSGLQVDGKNLAPRVAARKVEKESAVEARNELRR